MRRRLIPLLVAVICVLAVGSGFVVARSSATPVETTTAVEVGATLRRGGSQVLFSPRGRLGTIGRFRVSCGVSGRPATSYTVAPKAADTLAAVSGRGISRGAILIASSATLRGGSARAGIERWLVKMGRKPEDVVVEVSLVAVPRREGPGYCEFWLRGFVTVIRH